MLCLPDGILQCSYSERYTRLPADELRAMSFSIMILPSNNKGSSTWSQRPSIDPRLLRDKKGRFAPFSCFATISPQHFLGNNKPVSLGSILVSYLVDGHPFRRLIGNQPRCLFDECLWHSSHICLILYPCYMGRPREVPLVLSNPPMGGFARQYHACLRQT